MKRSLPLLVDAFLCVSILGSLVIVFWRDTWVILDAYLYPGDRIMSAVSSAGIFVCTQLLGELLQCGIKEREEVLHKLPFMIYLIIQDIFFLMLSIGDIACWRSIWMTVDIILESIESELARPILCSVAFLVLVLGFSSTSAVLKGYNMDGEQTTWYQLPNSYLQSIHICWREKSTNNEVCLPRG